MKNKDSRIIYLDVLRVIACLSVIMIHSSSDYVCMAIGSRNFWIGNIFDGLSRIGVPIFVMISGALMLDRNYEFTPQKLIKHIKKMIIFFVFWSAAYCLMCEGIEKTLIKHKYISIYEFICSFIEGHYHLWFVYLIIGLYLIVPLLRLWVKDENIKYIEYYLILSIIFTYFIPQIVSVSSYYNNSFQLLNTIVEEKTYLKYVGGFTAYFILGWYLNNYDIKNKGIVYILGVLGSIISIVGTYILSVTTGKELQMYGNLSLNVLLQSLAVFVFIKDKFGNANNNKFISAISKNSLGIYAIHVEIVGIMYEFLHKTFSFALVNIPFVFIVAFLVSYIITLILSKIPILKNVV